MTFNLRKGWQYLILFQIAYNSLILLFLLHLYKINIFNFIGNLSFYLILILGFIAIIIYNTLKLLDFIIFVKMKDKDFDWLLLIVS